MVAYVCKCVEEMVRIECFILFQAQDDIREVEWSRGLGNVYERQVERLAQIIDGEPVRIGLSATQAPVTYIHMTLTTNLRVSISGGSLSPKAAPIPTLPHTVTYPHIPLSTNREGKISLTCDTKNATNIHNCS